MTCGDRAKYFLLGTALPIAALFWANFAFTYNHFYVTGPYMHDAGWFSYIVYRQGGFPHNPAIAERLPSYFSLHVSLAISAASVVSSVVPLDRVDWYCIFQGAIYAPLGFAVALLFPAGARPTPLRLVGAIGLSSIVFSFNGQAIACMLYPHYEILIADGICLMLAGLAVGRTRIAAAGLALAIAAREDGGLHAAAFLVALLASDVLGQAFPVARRRVWTMLGIAIAGTICLMALQKGVFHAKGLFKHEYLGQPAYGHLTGAVLLSRVRDLLERSLFIVLPAMATIVLAAITRDPRWLLGWIIQIPWFLLNFLACQPLKAHFSIYTGFPFIGSIFWIGAYGRVRSGARWTCRPILLPVAGISLLSLLGYGISLPDFLLAGVEAMWAPHRIDGAAIRRYARELRARPDAYGRILVDPAMASWALESLRPEEVVHNGTDGIGFRDWDSFTFFRTGLLGPTTFNALARGHFSSCAEMTDTAIVLCSREERWLRDLPPNFRRIDFIQQSLWIGAAGRRQGERILVGPSARRDIGTFGPFMALAPGRYRAVFAISGERCADASADRPRAEADVYVAGRVLVKTAIAEPEVRPLELEFEIPRPSPLRDLELRAWTGACPYVVDGVELKEL